MAARSELALTGLNRRHCPASKKTKDSLPGVERAHAIPTALQYEGFNPLLATALPAVVLLALGNKVLFPLPRPFVCFSNV